MTGPAAAPRRPSPSRVPPGDGSHVKGPLAGRHSQQPFGATSASRPTDTSQVSRTGEPLTKNPAPAMQGPSVAYGELPPSLCRSLVSHVGAGNATPRRLHRPLDMSLRTAARGQSRRKCINIKACTSSHVVRWPRATPCPSFHPYEACKQELPPREPSQTV